MASTKIVQAFLTLKDKVLLSSGINLINSNSTDINEIALEKNAIYPGIAVPIFNNFFRKRKRNKGFLPEAIIMAMSFVLIIMSSATVMAANANLSALTISAGTFTPVFASGTYSYAVSENSTTASVTVNPTQVIAGSVIKVNGTTVASGTNSGAIALSAGANTITIVVTSAGNTTETYTITVTRQNISYTGSPYTFVNGYSIASQTPTVTGSPTGYSISTALPAGLSFNIGNGVISGTPTANSAAANYTVTANYAGGITATTIINITVSNTAVLTITAVSPASQVYGSVTIPALTVTYSGFVNGDTQANMILLPSVSTTATSTSNAGTYPITASGAQAPAYYTINYVAGTFTITGAPMTITATGPAENPGATPTPGPYSTNFTYSGALNGETVTSVTLTFNPTTMGAGGTPYTVTPSAATGANGFQAGNYTITYKVFNGTVANNYTWTGNTNSTWSTNTNWSSNITPGASDNVTIPTTAIAPVVTASTSVNNITFTGDNTITINTAGTTLTVNKSFTIPSGINANISMGSTTAALTIGLVSSAANINNAGNFQVTGGLLHVNAGTNYIYNSGTFTVHGGNKFDITGNGSSGNTAIFNVGTFYVGTSNSACLLTFDDSQSILNESGGNFYIGSTSDLQYFNVSAHDCTVTNVSGGTFTLQSDQYGSASILAIPQQASPHQNTFVGTFTVERYLSGQRGYRLIASPVYASISGSNKIYSLNYVQNSAYITGTNAGGGFDKVSQGPTLYLYREDVAVSNATFISGNYQSINNLNAAPSYTFDVTSGSYTIPNSNGFLFFFRGNNADGTVAQETVTTWPATTATLSTSGTLNQGQVVFRDWYTPGSNLLGRVNANIAAQGFNLAANPYPCTIDWETYNTTTTGTGIYTQNVSTFVYELNPTNKNYGQYQKGTGFNTNNASRYIVSGQGFFVLATTAAAQLILNETAKTSVVTQNTGPKLLMGKPEDLAANYKYLRLQMAKDSINTDDIVISFNDKAKTKLDLDEDAPYRVGLGMVSLSSLSSDNVPLAINLLPLRHKSQTIALKVGATTDGIYTLNMNEIKEIPRLYDIWLMDAYKKDSLDMRHNKTYSFSINKIDTSSFGSTRFTLVLRQNPLYAYHLVDFNANKVPNTREVLVVWKTENEQNYTNFTVERSTDKGQNFDVLGSVDAAAQGTYSFLDKTPVNGENIYRLKQVDYNNTITYSKIIPVEYSSLSNNLVKNNINVYPNPARSTINLAIAGNGNTPVTYSIMIMNGSGSLIKKTTTSQSNWQSSVADLFPGTYMVKVFNNKDQSLVGSTKFVKL